MTAQATATSVQTEVTVKAPIERAFRVFTEEIASWWHPEHHILQGELKEMVFEPRAGGFEAMGGFLERDFPRHLLPLASVAHHR